MAQQLDFNVRYSKEGFRWMSFDASCKGYDAIFKIVSSNFLEVHRDYILFYRQPERHTPVWLPTTETLADYHKKYDIPNQALLELRRHPQVIYWHLSTDGDCDFNKISTDKYRTKTVRTDVTLSVMELIEELKHVHFDGKLAEGEDYAVRHIYKDGADQVQMKWINANRSFIEQDVRAQDYLLMYPVSLLLKKTIGELTTQAHKRGFLKKWSVKESKVTRKKKRFCILVDNFLYYAKDDTSQHLCAGVLMTDYYATSRKMLKKMHMMEFTLSAPATFSKATGSSAATYVFASEVEPELDSWSDAVSPLAAGQATRAATVVQPFTSSGDRPVQLSAGQVISVLGEPTNSHVHVCAFGSTFSCPIDYVSFSVNPQELPPRPRMQKPHQPPVEQQQQQQQPSGIVSPRPATYAAAPAAAAAQTPPHAAALPPLAKVATRPASGPVTVAPTTLSVEEVLHRIATLERALADETSNRQRMVARISALEGKFKS